MKIISLDSAHFYNTNSMNRGVQTFTSFISDESQFIFLNEHLERLLEGADFLFPHVLWHEKKEAIVTFLKAQFVPSHYFRLSISGDDLVFTKKPHAPKGESVSLRKAESSKVQNIVPSFVKSANYLVSELEVKKALENGFQDVIFFDQSQNLTEASTSNVFLVKADKTILTPKDSSMVLRGVTRKKLIEYLTKIGFKVTEKDISKSELESSQEIWLTNAIQGIRFVDRFENIQFSNSDQYRKVSAGFGRFGEKFNRE